MLLPPDMYCAIFSLSKITNGCLSRPPLCHLDICIHLHPFVENWDVSQVVNMNHLFRGPATAFNGDISNWDTSAVTSMNSMFSGCNVFNADISAWQTGTKCNPNEKDRNLHYIHHSDHRTFRYWNLQKKAKHANNLDLLLQCLHNMLS